MPIKKISKALKGAIASQKRVSTIVALDIGTENVKALICQPDGTGELTITGFGRSKQGLNDMKTGAIADIQAVVENCDKALRQAEQQSGDRAKNVVVGIAGELIKGITNSLKVERDDPEKPLDADELDGIVKIVQADAYDEAKHEVSLELGTKEVELKLVNSAIVSIKIDGYKVTNPISFQGKEVEVQLYTAFAPLVHIGAIEHVVRDLDLDLIAVAAEPFAVARGVVGDDVEASLNAILIDVGGGTTDIAVLRDGGLEGTSMFGIGGRSFTRVISRDLGVSFEEAETMKLGLSQGELKGDSKTKVVEALTKNINVWIEGIHLALAEFDWLDYLPSKILLCGGGSSLELLQDKLRQVDWQKGLAFSKIPDVQFIESTEVVGITDTTGGNMDHTTITAMGLARVGSDTTYGFSQSKKSVKGRVDGILAN